MTEQLAAAIVAGGAVIVAGVLTLLGVILQHLAKRVADLESDQLALWKARQEDALTMRAQGDHIDVLEQHIWERKGPPPPTRPVGV